MKMIVFLTLLITVVCILAAGCIGQTNKDTVPEKCVCPVCPVLNATSTNTTFPEPNMTANITKLKGPLRISISGFNAVLDVTLDNQTVGNVTMEKPLDLMVDEGNHIVQVCVGSICENEGVNIVFAKRSLIDFGERLRKNVAFPTPTARIIDYFRSGDSVYVIVEFINPSLKPLSMTAEVSVGYSFIDERTDLRVAESTRGKAQADVKAGQRETDVLSLDFSNGYSYIFDPPALGQITTN